MTGLNDGVWSLKFHYFSTFILGVLYRNKETNTSFITPDIQKTALTPRTLQSGPEVSSLFTNTLLPVIVSFSLFLTFIFHKVV